MARLERGPAGRGQLALAAAGVTRTTVAGDILDLLAEGKIHRVPSIFGQAHMYALSADGP